VLQSTAVVATDAPERYAKQLLSHLGRKNTVETVDGERHGGRLVFAYGTGTVRPQDHQLVLEAAPRTPTRSPMPKTCSPATWSGSGQNASWWGPGRAAAPKVLAAPTVSAAEPHHILEVS
jgi:Uncharacterized protein conserved in bacteria (DUF2218)